MSYYLMFGLGFYAGCFFMNPEKFEDQTLKSILLGIIVCVFLWPFALVSLIYPFK